VKTEEEGMRAHIATQLRVAMKARDVSRIAALRSLSAALDNATAVPLPGRLLPNDRREVPRKELSALDIRAIVMREITERREAAATLTAHGCRERAAVVEGEIKVLEPYIDWPASGST
jgi:uncharacterized protein YqeY